MIEHGPIGPRDVLLVVDVQNDFCSGGKLAVPGGEEVVPALNRLATQFEHVVLTQDWHPAATVLSHPAIPAAARMTLSNWPTVPKSYGPTIVSRARQEPSSDKN
jgi:nicotinamidase/pyrazinamidase